MIFRSKLKLLKAIMVNVIPDGSDFLKRLAEETNFATSQRIRRTTSDPRDHYKQEGRIPVHIGQTRQFLTVVA